MTSSSRPSFNAPSSASFSTSPSVPIGIDRIAEVALPSDRDRALAADAFAAIAGSMTPSDASGMTVQVEGGPAVVLPAPAAKVLAEALGLIARGEAVLVASAPQEVSSVQAAELLDLNFDTMARLCMRGEIPSRIEDGHRRIRVADLVVWRDRRDAARRAEEQARRKRILDELTAHDQALGLY